MTPLQTRLWQVAMVCSGLLIFAPLTPRTSWAFVGGERGGGAGA